MRFDLTGNSEFNVRHLTIELSLVIKGYRVIVFTLCQWKVRGHYSWPVLRAYIGFSPALIELATH